MICYMYMCMHIYSLHIYIYIYILLFSKSIRLYRDIVKSALRDHPAIWDCFLSESSLLFHLSKFLQHGGMPCFSPEKYSDPLPEPTNFWVTGTQMVSHRWKHLELWQRSQVVTWGENPDTGKQEEPYEDPRDEGNEPKITTLQVWWTHKLCMMPACPKETFDSWHVVTVMFESEVEKVMKSEFQLSNSGRGVVIIYWTGLREHLQDTSKFHGQKKWLPLGFLNQFTMIHPWKWPYSTHLGGITGTRCGPLFSGSGHWRAERLPRCHHGGRGAQKDGGSCDDEDDKNDDEDDDTCITTVIITIE